ncbi:MAG: patatin-like phospholipase family protein [Wenzhouxiangellaceae bacterium]|nr:patatin-like phospholipase family protein [Wenzhouxiangellaceae bacterium]
MGTKCELGLVMAGAVSAGAYTAGVVDFLIQALEEWQRAREAGDDTAPPHEVRLRIISGASAGGMTAAMLAGLAAGREHRPIGNDDPGEDVADNVLYQSWVNDIDIEPLLGRRDLDDDRLVSLLDSTVLDEIAEHALPLDRAGQRRAWVDENAELILTIANLRGVPYNIPFADDSDGRAAPERPGHGMRQHRDYLHFSFGEEPGTASHRLDWQMRGDNWLLLRQAALATGAFPLGLAPRRIGQGGDFYNQRRFRTEGRGKLPDGDCECIVEPEILPAWGGPAPADYAFTAVDGGLFDNEPYELTRSRLNRNRPEDFDESATRRIMLAVDPFPNTQNFADEEAGEPDSLPALLLGLLGAMKNQGRFKPAELAVAARHISASRRIIAPSRDGAQEDESPIASGPLGGFAGFLDRNFRHHDFMLGRANCQSFLRNHFSLPADNALIADWTEAQRRTHRTADGKCPVIPLFGSARDEVVVPPWPSIAGERIDDLRRKLKKRINRMLPILFREVVPGNRFLRWAAVQLARWTQTGDWARRAANHTREELVKAGIEVRGQ